jgi:hypothetical protein
LGLAGNAAQLERQFRHRMFLVIVHWDAIPATRMGDTGRIWPAERKKPPIRENRRLSFYCYSGGDRWT